jgi:hypothetical protein
MQAQLLMSTDDLVHPSTVLLPDIYIVYGAYDSLHDSNNTVQVNETAAPAFVQVRPLTHVNCLSICMA